MASIVTRAILTVVGSGVGAGLATFSEIFCGLVLKEKIEIGNN
jgi:hypothetical protein